LPGEEGRLLWDVTFLTSQVTLAARAGNRLRCIFMRSEKQTFRAIRDQSASDLMPIYWY
jgi:hypothetical protein